MGWHIVKNFEQECSPCVQKSTVDFAGLRHQKKSQHHGGAKHLLQREHLDRLHNLLLDAWHRNIHDLFHGALLDALLRHKLNQLHKFHQDLWHWPVHDLLHDSIRHTLLRSYVDDFNSLRHWNIHDFLNGALLDALLRDQTRKIQRSLT